MRRTLSLKKDTLTPLSADELALVAAGGEPNTIPLRACLYPELPSVPLHRCLEEVYLYLPPLTEGC